MSLVVRGIPSAFVKEIRAGGVDANGQKAQTRVAEGLMNPCRHCLEIIAEGEQKLVLSYRPFETLQPYAETGPIFLHKNSCTRYSSNTLPQWFNYLEPAIVRGYGSDHWIRYDTGYVIPGKELTAVCESILSDKTIGYVHIRSKYNCFQCRVDRG